MKKFLIITAYVLGSILGICFVTFIGFVIYESHRERAKQSWEWQHYTGNRLIAHDDTAHGIFLDKKTNKDCSMLAYPGYPACPTQVYVVNGEPLEQVCKKWEDKHPIGSPVDRLFGQWDNGEKMPPEGVIVGVPDGCKGPLETGYEEKVPKIDFDALAKQNGGRVLGQQNAENVFDQLARKDGRAVEIYGGETLHIAPEGPNHPVPSGSIPLIYLGHNQKFIFACGVYGETQIPTHFPSIKKGNWTCP